MPRSFEWSLHFKIHNQNIVCISYLPHAHYMPHTSHNFSFDHSNNVG
jgi:hypothetical protein